MRKIYIVPNMVTTMNIAAGFFSVISSVQGKYVVASWAILAAAVFDMLDGRIARMTRATSQFGVEYDSLSDVLSFGMAPALLTYLWVLSSFGRLGLLASFLFLACGALRLARFNVTTSALPKGYFQGVPIPIGAGVIATFVIFHAELQWPEEPRWAVLGLTLAMASLMVSTIPFPSFKEFSWRSRASFGYLTVGVMMLILIAVRPEVTLFGLAISFVILGFLANLVRIILGKPIKMNPKERISKN